MKGLLKSGITVVAVAEILGLGMEMPLPTSENYKHPFFWASFIPSGDWTTIKFD